MISIRIKHASETIGILSLADIVGGILVVVVVVGKTVTIRDNWLFLLVLARFPRVSGLAANI